MEVSEVAETSLHVSSNVSCTITVHYTQILYWAFYIRYSDGGGIFGSLSLPLHLMLSPLGNSLPCKSMGWENQAKLLPFFRLRYQSMNGNVVIYVPSPCIILILILIIPILLLLIIIFLIIKHVSFTFLSMQGRTYPVDIFYVAEPVADYVMATAETIINIHRDCPSGDVLAFLTGQEEVGLSLCMLSMKLLWSRCDSLVKEFLINPSINMHVCM